MYPATTTKVMALTVAVMTASGFALPASADIAGRPPSDKFDLSH